MQAEQKELVRMFLLKITIKKEKKMTRGVCSVWFGFFSVLWFFSSDRC